MSSTKEIVTGAAAVAVIYGLYKLFAPSRDEREAARFPDLWELNEPRALQIAATKGLVSIDDVQQVNVARGAAIAQAIAQLIDAPANWYAWDDDERAVIAAVMRPTYAEQLLFASTWTATVGGTVGGFILGFMSPRDEDDARYLATIVRHVERLRP